MHARCLVLWRSWITRKLLFLTIYLHRACLVAVFSRTSWCLCVKIFTCGCVSASRRHAGSTQRETSISDGCAVAMFADAAFNWDISCSQKTQATVTTSAIGTQCPLKLLISASSQTEEEFPVLGVDKVQDGASQEFPASGGGADTVTKACPRTYSSPPHSGNTGILFKILSGGVLHSGQSSEHKHASPQGKVGASNMAYICTVCAKVFYGNSKIDRHMRVHTGERPYTCTVCRKSFTQKEHLVCHERMHSGERPYVCSTCHESFNRRGHLVAHERLHSGDRPYVCSTCRKSFIAKSRLLAHERVHSGERPYVCTTCQKSFTAKSGLHKHEKLKHS